MQQTLKLWPLLSLGLLLAVVSMCGCADRGGRRIQAQEDANKYPNFKSPCGTPEQVSRRIGECLVDIFQLIEGDFSPPKNDQDLSAHCNRFAVTERCTRAAAKDCLQGLHKTAVGAVSSATRRFKQQECKSAESRSRYLDPLKCAIRRGSEMKELYRNSTGVLQGIRDLNIAPEEKLIKMCCLMNQLDKDIERVYDRDCPKLTPIMIGIVHAMTDDARNTLCIRPKCNGALDKVMGSKYTPPQNFIEPVMQILFQITVT